ncbi:hypothetical protein BY996DRAFT_4637077 [Phakopsora pachyrhizi]|nr:hypothetical protein BY996DRAFT_4637077 [Phakopsora pachyrhizi]
MSRRLTGEVKEELTMKIKDTTGKSPDEENTLKSRGDKRMKKNKKFMKNDVYESLEDSHKQKVIEESANDEGKEKKRISKKECEEGKIKKLKIEEKKKRNNDYGDEKEKRNSNIANDSDSGDIESDRSKDLMERKKKKKNKKVYEKDDDRNNNQGKGLGYLLGTQTLHASKIDKELDDIFKTSSFTALESDKNQNSQKSTEDSQTKEPNPLSNPKLSKTLNIEKPKSIDGSSENLQSSKPEVSKQRMPSIESSYEKNLEIQRAKRVAQAIKEKAEKVSLSSKHRKIGEKKVNCIPGSESSSDDDNDEKEEYSKFEFEENNEYDDNTEEYDDNDTKDKDSSCSSTQLVHETLLESSKKQPRIKKIDVTGETRDQINARTVFVGNVNMDCLKNKQNTRALLNHLLNPLGQEKPLAPRSRIESYRFRGIPLAKPIQSNKMNDPEARSVKRSRAWKESQREQDRSFNDPDGGKAGNRGAKPVLTSNSIENQIKEVKFLSTEQKRKIGYLTKDFHPEAKSCIAYVVIRHVENSDGECLPAKELARKISSNGDGTTFMGHVLRCDIASNNRSSHDGSGGVSIDEQQRTIFVGGLDFNEQEDVIQKSIEDCLIKESDGPPEGEASWVERVRLVRDKSTALNKGFAYVLLRNKDAVEEMLCLPEGSFKIGNRKVRLQKCFSLGRCKFRDASNSERAKDHKFKAKGKVTGKIDLTDEIKAIYRGPDMSKELGLLSKIERKLMKSNNADRVERRMLKKQAKLKMTLMDKDKSKFDKAHRVLGRNKHQKSKSRLNPNKKNQK